MDTKALLSAALAGSLLAGCSSEPEIDARDASVADVQEQLAKTDARPRPGRWQQEMKIISMDMPDMPAQAQTAMPKAGDTMHSGFVCLTPEQAAKPDAELFQQVAEGCTYDHFKMAGGTIDAKMTCTGGPQQQVSTMQGTYSAEAYDLVIDMQAEMMGQPMHSKMALKMTQVGDCTGEEGFTAGG